MLILAAVAINMAINSDGLFGKASDAAGKWNSAVDDERTTLLDYLDKMEEVNGGIADIIPEIDGLPAKKTAAELAEYIPIYTTEQLRKVATGESVTIEGTTYTMAADAKYALINDLDFSTVTGMKPIKGFTGTFEGNGCTITNLNIDVTTDAKTYTNVLGYTNCSYPGALFETAVGATIKNLAVTNANIKAKESVSAIVGQGDNVTIENCYVKDSALAGINSCGNIIGFVGENGANISDCKVINTTIETIEDLYIAHGGICGVSYGDIEIANCQVIGNEDETVSYRSGIIHHNKKNAEINDCKVQNLSVLYAGVLGVGSDYSSQEQYTVDVINCTAKNVKTTESSAAGILGYSQAYNINIEGCKAENIGFENASYVSAVVAVIGGQNIKIDACSAKNITVDSNYSTSTNAGVAGIVGVIYNSSAKSIITNCKVDGIKNDFPNWDFGGIARVIYGDLTMENCTADNLEIKLSNGGPSGGILGTSHANGIIKNCSVNKFNILGESIYNSGGVLGVAGNSSVELEINNCNVADTKIEGSYTSGTYNYGGIAGFMYKGTISNCKTSNVTINLLAKGTSTYARQSRIGGIIGGNNEAIIKGCSVYDGTITDSGSSIIGGICGFGVNISNCNVENTNITASGTAQSVAGILGQGQKNSTIESLVQNCKVNNCTIISYDAQHVGGISGVAVGTISKCSVVGSTITGGIESLGGIQGFGGALGTATGSGGSTTSVVIDNCDATNCNLISVAINKDYIQGNNSYDQTNTSNDKITNCTHEGTTLSGKTEISNEIPEEWDSTKVLAVVKELNRKAPIPKGFVASQIPTESTIQGGLVIYQGTEPVTGETNSTAHITAMTTRNQFVWIPVDDIDYMVMCKSNASGSVCDLELVNGVLKCTNAAHSSTATDLCGRVYATTISNTTVDSKKIYTYSQTFTEAEWTKQKWNTSSYREPDIVSSYDKDSNTSYLTAAGVSTTSALATQLTNDFKTMATSVAKYGGFYVSRYEAGANGASTKNQKALVAGASTITGYDTNTFISGNMWYGMYNTIRSSTAIDKTAVNSHMIWGSQYDMIIKYLGKNSTNQPQVGHIARPLATQELTGQTTTDIMSNIYDLEGNNEEWTAQASGTEFRILRGGVFNSVAGSSVFNPASSRSYNCPGYTYCSYASRSVLYVK